MSLPCTTVYDASTEDRLVMTVTSSSLLELSMSMLMERSISRCKLVTMPVGYVTLVRRPSLSYLGDVGNCGDGEGKRSVFIKQNTHSHTKTLPEKSVKNWL